MKWMRMYLLGYSIVLVGLLAALWKLGVLERVRERREAWKDQVHL